MLKLSKILQILLRDTCHSFNSARMIFDSCFKLVNIYQIETYDAGQVRRYARFRAEFRVKIARLRCALDGSGWSKSWLG